MGVFNKKKSEANGRARPTRQSKSPIFSYYQNRDDESRPVKTDTPTNYTWLHKLPMYVASIVIVICLLYTLMLSTNPRVVIVNDQDKSVQPFLREQQTYQTIVSKELASSIFNHTKLTMNTEKIEADLKQQIPEATDISVTLPLIDRKPVVYVRIAEPVFVVKGNTGNAFVVDEQGRAVADADKVSDADSLVKINDRSGLPLEPGKAVLPANYVSFIQEIKTQLDAKGIKIDHIILPADANALWLYPKGLPYYVKFNISVDPNEQVGRYIAVKGRVHPNSYIDVRVNERAFVR